MERHTSSIFLNVRIVVDAASLPNDAYALGAALHSLVQEGWYLNSFVTGTEGAEAGLSRGWEVRDPPLDFRGGMEASMIQDRSD